MSFGFTNDATRFQAVIAFKEAAIKDGWKCRPTYVGHEDESRAASLEKDGYKMMIITRENIGKWKYEADTSCWGADGLAISLPYIYNWEAIVAGLRICDNCRVSDVDTFRYSFAGRCCKQCLPEMRRQYEYPG